MYPLSTFSVYIIFLSSFFPTMYCIHFCLSASLISFYRESNLIPTMTHKMGLNLQGGHTVTIKKHFAKAK